MYRTQARKIVHSKVWVAALANGATFNKSAAERQIVTVQEGRLSQRATNKIGSSEGIAQQCKHSMIEKNEGKQGTQSWERGARYSTKGSF